MVLERLASGVVVIARPHLAAGEELVHAQGHIASWGLTSNETIAVEPRHGRAARLLEVPS